MLLLACAFFVYADTIITTPYRDPSQNPVQTPVQKPVPVFAWPDCLSQQSDGYIVIENNNGNPGFFSVGSVAEQKISPYFEVLYAADMVGTVYLMFKLQDGREVAAQVLKNLLSQALSTRQFQVTCVTRV